MTDQDWYDLLKKYCIEQKQYDSYLVNKHDKLPLKDWFFKRGLGHSFLWGYFARYVNKESDGKASYSNVYCTLVETSDEIEAAEGRGSFFSKADLLEPFPELKRMLWNVFHFKLDYEKRIYHNLDYYLGE